MAQPRTEGPRPDQVRGRGTDALSTGGLGLLPCRLPGYASRQHVSRAAYRTQKPSGVEPALGPFGQVSGSRARSSGQQDTGGDTEVQALGEASHGDAHRAPRCTCQLLADPLVLVAKDEGETVD
jgi:hypothetical protein